MRVLVNIYVLFMAYILVFIVKYIACVHNNQFVLFLMMDGNMQFFFFLLRNISIHNVTLDRNRLSLLFNNAAQLLENSEIPIFIATYSSICI